MRHNTLKRYTGNYFRLVMGVILLGNTSVLGDTYENKFKSF